MKRTHSIPSARRQVVTQNLSRHAREATMAALKQGRSSPSNPLPPLLVEPAATSIAPRQMAAAQRGDAATQQWLAASYETCLRTYRDIARAQGGPADVDDVGAVMAFFIGVNLHALHGTDVEADALPPLERQLRGVTRLAADWDRATATQRQAFFERIAILSILMSRSLSDADSRGPAAVADVRRSARDYLQHALGLDPDLVTLGDDGLALRANAVGTQTSAAAIPA